MKRHIRELKAVIRKNSQASHWISNNYWHVDEGKGWVFTDRRSRLWLHDYTQIQHHSSGMLGKLLQKQAGKCRWCELLFQDGDSIEIDTIPSVV